MSVTDAAVAARPKRRDAAAAERRLRVVVLHCTQWQPRFDNHQPGESSDPFALQRVLAEQGIDLVLVDPNGRRWNPLSGRSPMLEGMDPLRACRILVRERQADLILCINEGTALPLILLRRLSRFGVPIVVWDLILSEVWRLRKRVLDIVVPAAQGLLVASKFQRDYVERQWGRTEGVDVVGHLMDTGFWHSSIAAPPAGPVITVGNDHSRDFDLLLDAIEGLDADLLLRTNRIAPDRLLPPRVTVLRDRVSETALRELYEACRFVVVPLRPTLNAGGINTIMEAAAMGRALIVSDSPVIRDFLVPDHTCLVVPCGDRDALRAAIQRLLNEPETCARLGRNARLFAEQHVSVRAFADRLAATLRRRAQSADTQHP